MYVAELYDCDDEGECEYQSLSGCIDFVDYLFIIRYCCRTASVVGALPPSVRSLTVEG